MKQIKEIFVKKAIIQTLFNLLLAIMWYSIGYYYGSQSVIKAETTFDHSQCQYPNRLSNPANGCDNTDPACPAEIKGGTCENYQPTEQELAPYVPETTQQPATTEIKPKTCVKWE